MDNQELVVWRWFDGLYKVHISDANTYKQILRWRKSHPGGIYSMPNGAIRYDVIIPEEYLNRLQMFGTVTGDLEWVN